VVAVVATGAAGVNESLFRSGSSSDLRRLGEPARPEGEVGLDDCGEMWAGREGMGRRRLGCREEGPADAWVDPLPPPWPAAVPVLERAGEPCWADGVLPMATEVREVGNGERGVDRMS
jgi:hypothetical protein